MMKRLSLVCVFLAALTFGAFAQTNPNLIKGQVLTAAQWNALFASKQDVLGFTPLNTAGGVMTGRLVTSGASATQGGLNIPQSSTVPGTPSNGDLWITASGMFVQINGVTVALTGAASTSFAATLPLTVSFPSGIVTYALNINTSLRVDGSNNLGLNTQGANTVLANVTGSTAAPTAASLPSCTGAASALQYTLGTGFSCGTITASASSITAGTTTVSGGPGVLFNTSNGGTLSSSPTIPFAVVIQANSATAFIVGPNGTTNPALTVQTNVTSQVTGIAVVGGLSGGGGGIVATSSSSSEPLTLNAKGAQAVFIGGISTGGVNIGAGGGGVVITGATSITSSSAIALTVGPNGSTNPTFSVAANVTSEATGLQITGQASGSGTFLTVTSPGTNDNFSINAKGSGLIAIGNVSTGGVTLAAGGGGVSITGTTTITSSSSAALVVGANGSTNPALQVDASTSSSVTGLAIKSQISGNGVNLTTISSATNDTMQVNAKGSGTTFIGNLSSGGVNIGSGGGVVTVPATLTVQIANSNALTVGPNGATNPALQINSSAASSATGLAITSAAAGSRVFITAISSNASEILNIDAKGSSAVVIGSASSGGVNLAAAGGGVTVAGAVTTSSGPSSSAANQYVYTVATGTIALSTSAISPSTCTSAQTATATGTASTDIVDASFNSDPTSTVGYTSPNMLTIVIWPSSNTFNLKVCNNTSGSITPGAVTLNWRVRR